MPEVLPRSVLELVEPMYISMPGGVMLMPWLLSQTFVTDDLDGEPFDAKRERDRERQRCKTQLCKYHPNCARGDKCWFSHNPDAAAQARVRPMTCSLPAHL